MPGRHEDVVPRASTSGVAPRSSEPAVAPARSAIPAEVFDPARLAAVRASGLMDSPTDESFDRLAELAALVLRTPFAFITIVDGTRSFWTSFVGDSPGLTVRENPVEQTLSQHVIATGQPVVIGDTNADPRVTDEDPSISLGMAAWAGVPLRGPTGQILGAFCVLDTVERAWAPDEIQVLSILAAAASSEISLRASVAATTDAVIAAQEANLLLSLLAQVSEVLSISVDAEVAVGMLAGHIVPSLGDWCLISVIDDLTGVVRTVGAAHREPELLAQVEHHAALDTERPGSPMAVVVRTGLPLIIDEDDRSSLDMIIPTAAGRSVLDAASAAVFPLRGRGGAFGAIALVNSAARGPHTAAELSIGKLMARRAGLSLDNARLHQRQQRIAETLQRSMLTAPPRIDGMQIACRYLPAAQGAQVGGDWYDAYQLPDGSTILSIGDVVGHDLHAVTIMGQIRTLTRGISYDRNAGPGEILIRVDAALRGLHIAGLCTAVVVRIARIDDSGGLDLTWSSAGHPAPLILLPDGTVSELVAKPDLLLGMGTEAERQEHHLRLPADATLLMMTDGLFERRYLAYDDSVNRLRASLEPLVGLPLESLCDAILAAAAQDEPEDDIALIAVRPT